MAPGLPGAFFSLVPLVALLAFKVLSNFVTSAFSFPIGLVSPLGPQLAELALT